MYRLTSFSNSEVSVSSHFIQSWPQCAEQLLEKAKVEWPSCYTMRSSFVQIMSLMVVADVCWALLRKQNWLIWYDIMIYSGDSTLLHWSSMWWSATAWWGAKWIETWLMVSWKSKAKIYAQVWWSLKWRYVGLKSKVANGKCQLQWVMVCGGPARLSCQWHLQSVCDGSQVAFNCTVWYSMVC